MLSTYSPVWRWGRRERWAGIGKPGLKEEIGVPGALSREEARWAADLPSKQGTGARAACPHPGRAGKRDPR